jgi:hypothetical protein
LDILFNGTDVKIAKITINTRSLIWYVFECYVPVWWMMFFFKVLSVVR